VQPPPPEAPAPPPQPAPSARGEEPAPHGAVAAVAVAVEVEPAPGMPLDLDGLRAVWPAVLEAVKGNNAMCAALLAEAQPIAVAGEQVTVGFPPTADFLRRKAEDETYKACVAEAVRTVTGSRVRMAYVLREPEAELAADAAAPAAPTEEEWVARFVAEFDAEEILPDPDSDSEAS
jgi:DNA polymerase-3 subunit gamma/tau